MQDYLIVGAGLAGASFARIMSDKGYKCTVIDKRNHIAGNIYSMEIEGIEVHQYGPHIFHTDNERVWEFINRFTRFNHFVYSPVASYHGELYSLPFNMNTFYQLWKIKTPREARDIIGRQVAESGITEPVNLEEQAVKLVGRDIYEKLIKGYTAKQWGTECSKLPPFIIKRLPVRFTYDNNYFDHPHQGIPECGYTAMVEQMLSGIDVRLNTDFLQQREEYGKLAKNIVFTGPIDAYYDYCYGELEYRSLRFETEVLDTDNYQGTAGMNYTDSDTPYTRIVEHKHFHFGKGNQHKTVITREYPMAWKQGDEAYYPINNERNNSLYKKYKNLAEQEKDVIFAGRLGMYQYFDMDKVIDSILNLTDEM
ncbi:UDP-galactopyranose mutase [Lachnospiraceae bacterium]|jgi:UDP-galactopyranose mutase|nr:UDP-galactopyranose mutase [uncultured Schaedlerella sp.]NBI60421.1 UDP-galactopyranose mutase [Lachnospiraceae bacterium]